MPSASSPVQRLVSLCPGCSSGLVMQCGEGEEALALLAASLQVVCVEPDPEYRTHLEGLASTRPALSVRASLPRSVQQRFDVLVVPSRALHSMARPAVGLRRLRQHLREGGLGLISCDGAQAHAGVAHVRRLMSMLVRDDDSDATKLQLAHALLSALPASNWFVKSPLARSLRETGSWDDGGTLWNHFLARRPTPELHVGSFVEILDRAGFGAPLQTGEEGPLLLTARDPPWQRRGSELEALSRAMPRVWRWQLNELLGGGTLEHVAIVRHARRAEWADGSCADPTRSDRCADGRWVDPLLGRTLRVGFELGRRSEAERASPRRLQERPVEDAIAGPSAVSAQYEALPFPPRSPGEERRRLIRSSLATLSELSHHAFGGRFRETFCGADRPPFRALVAGGGTGDATVQIALELADLAEAFPECGYERSVVHHVDQSARSVGVAAERLRARRLLPGGAVEVRPTAPSVRLAVGSLLDLPTRPEGSRYHFINWVGVLHHIDSSRAALRHVTRAALHPNGTIGLMVYGALGRMGVYALQAALRLLHAAGNGTAPGRHVARHPEARIRDAAELIRGLPAASSWRRAARVSSSHDATGRLGGAGLFDLLLSGTDMPYTLPQLIADAEASGLRESSMLTPKLYDWRAWLRMGVARRHPLLIERFDQLRDPPAAGELLSGHARKHWLFLRHRDAPPHRPMDESLSPCPSNVSKATLALLREHEGRVLRWRTDVQGEPLTLELPRATGAFLRRMDCRRPLRQLLHGIRLEATLDGREVDGTVLAQWRQLYEELSGLGFLTMTDHLQGYTAAQSTVL